MKKLFAFTVFLSGLSAVSAQESVSSARPVRGHAMKFATDQYIHNKPNENQENLHLASAFNGWIYAAYTVNDTLNHKGGITVRYSRDGGVTWMHFLNYQYTNSFYPLTSIVVTGTDTNNLDVFVAGVLKTVSTGTYSVYIDKFDGRNGNLISGQVFVRTLGTFPVYDIALASDYLFPAPVSSPYSVGFLYSRHGTTRDSVLFALSTNGGLSFGNRQTLATTSGVFHKVSLAYGHSVSASAGSYFAAWENKASASSMLGHICFSHSRLNINSSWFSPLCLDTLSGATANFTRNPVIAAQYTNTDNDSSNLTVIVSFECAQSGNTNDFDIMGYYNQRAQSGHTWNAFDPHPGPENDLQPQLIFDPLSSNFLLTYYDSTNGKLPYANHSMNMSLPNAWNYITMQYNDLTTNLSSPWPCLALNPLMLEPAFAWISQNSNGNGSAMFDAQYSGLLTGISPTRSESPNWSMYPNPANSAVVLNLNGLTGPAQLRIFDVLGNVVMPYIREPVSMAEHQITMDVSTLSNGVYFCSLLGDPENKSLRLVVQH